jgi:calcineurin-like phosphoesterase family protein
VKIISDTHFGHSNILKYEPIRIKTANLYGYRDFDKFLVDRLNKFIDNDDKVLHLGDAAFKRGYLLAEKLKGKITLLKGNHDKTSHLEFYKTVGWDVIEDIRVEIEINPQNLLFIYYKYDKKTFLNTSALIREIEGKRVLFSHYPVFNDNPYDEKYKNITNLLKDVFEVCECDINIHGHTHSYVVKDKRCVNACLEVNCFKPLEIGDIFK